MGISLHWFLSTSGDGRDIAGSNHAAAGRAVVANFREPTIDYLAQIARAADHLGFDGMLTPTGTWCEDAWITTAALLRETRRIKFMVAFRPGLVSPTLAAQMAATYQRHSQGRLLLNIVTGGDDLEMRRFGDHVSHDERYGRTAEFIEVVRGAWGPTPFDFDGEHYTVVGATVAAPPDPVPAIYFGGSSAPALAVAARHCDVYLTWGEPPAMVRQKIDAVRALAQAQGRTVRFGIRLHTISRDSPKAAWAEADRMLSMMDPAAVAGAYKTLSESQSEGQRRMSGLHGGDRSSLEIHPNLWAGVGLVRGGAGTALVGSHEQVADLMQEYHDLGIEEFVLSGYPNLEEAYWFAEGVRPVLAARGLLA